MRTFPIDAHAHLDQYSDGELPALLEEIREAPEEFIAEAVHENFALLIRDDPWLADTRSEFF